MPKNSVDREAILMKNHYFSNKKGVNRKLHVYHQVKPWTEVFYYTLCSCCTNVLPICCGHLCLLNLAICCYLGKLIVGPFYSF